MSKESWYSAKCIFLHAETESGHRQMYEERIILLKAPDFDEAIGRAENEAESYGRESDGCKYLGYADVFLLYDERIGDKTEIYSSLRRSSLGPKPYLEQFYPVEPDDCEAVGETHKWYNLDNVRSACYHCKIVRDGQLWIIEDKELK